MVAVSSGEVYGPPEALPVDETAPLRPQNPYAVSKAATDLLAGFYADAHGLRVVRARAFNHAGPGQPPLYALAAFARQVAAGLEAGDDPVRVVTGNPDVAPRLHRRPRRRRGLPAARRGRRAGRVQRLLGPRGVRPRAGGGAGRRGRRGRGPRRRPGRVRAHDVPEVRGSFARLARATGWEPRIPLRRTLADTVAWWRAELRAGRGAADGLSARLRL